MNNEEIVESTLRTYMMEQLDNLRLYFNDYIVERLEATPSSMKLQVKVNDKVYNILVQSSISEVK